MEYAVVVGADAMSLHERDGWPYISPSVMGQLYKIKPAMPPERLLVHRHEHHTVRARLCNISAVAR